MTVTNPYLDGYKFPQQSLPKTHVISNGKDKGAKNKKRKEKKVVRGKEVSITESASETQIVYGEMKVGGVITYVDTNADNKAYLVSGADADDNQLVWTAQTAGAGGNLISITLVNPGGTTGSIVIGVVTNAITVTLKATGGNSVSTMAQVITAITADVSASALVKTRKLDSTKNGVVKAAALTNLAYGGGSSLYQVITFAGHEITSLDKLYLNNEEVSFSPVAIPVTLPDNRWATGKWSNKVFLTWEYGTDTQDVNPDLYHQKPTVWTANCLQLGNAYAVLILVWNENLFSDGNPEVAFKVRGKPCLDTRTSTTAYTTNAALIIADYLTNTKYGMGVSWSDIDTTALNASANTCDEVVTTVAGTEARYSINGVFDSSATPNSILDEMSAAMAGDIVFQEGKWHILAGTYRSPTITLTLADAREDFTVNTTMSRSDMFNSVRGTYVNPSDDYNEADIPPITNATYVASDGGIKVWEDVALNFVTSASQAQRLLKIELERIRQGITVEWKGNASCLRLRAGDTVQLTIARYGWTAKVFEVRNVSFVIDDSGILGADLTLRETASGIYDWNSGEETTIDLSLNTDLPDPEDVAVPTGVTLSSGTSALYQRLDGTIFSRLKIAWTVSASQFVQTGGFYEIQYKKNVDSNWTSIPRLPGIQDFYFILDVQDGIRYDVRIRSVNTLSYASDWVTTLNYLVLGKQEPPPDVLNFNASVSDLGIAFSWDTLKNLDLTTVLDLSFYEIREGTVWNTATLIAKTRTSDGNTFLYQVLTAGTHNFLIKALDTSGIYSTNATVKSVVIVGPTPVTGFNISTLENNVLLDWDNGAATSLTVNKYLVYKATTGAAFATATLIGTAFGTFHTYLEKYGGTFDYWIVAEDVGGNLSTRVMYTATIIPSSNFFINDDQFLYPKLTTSNFGVPVDSEEAVFIVYGVNAPVGMQLPWMLMQPIYGVGVGETWASHFTNNSWTTVQAAITAGYSYYLQPVAGLGGGSGTPTAVVEFHVDYGVTFSSSFVDFSWLEESLEGSITITPTIYTSPDDTVWTTYAGANQVFASNFRYVKFRLEGVPANVFSISKLTNFRAVVSVQRTEETQVVTVPAGGSLVVNFVKTFLDVEDIQVSINNTSNLICFYSYNYATVPAVQSMTVYVKTLAGANAGSDVSCRIRGAIGA